ncbi:MAG: PTS IIA-like nitrogen regulatory protein PtsN [Candidatus Accumulibacter sp.]|jgi:PTS system nitrogen regulatory IIA component|nr:PTS IIA-like nitrogen regulatory protein PtsN [Accumulibacter sp.]
MSQILQLLPPENIVLDLDASSKKRVLEHAGLVFENNQAVASRLVFDSLFSREKLGSTGLGCGVAIPHGRIKGLKKACGAFIRLATPIPFDSPDGEPVSMLFVLLVPEQATEQHLQILSELAERFTERSCREALAQAKDAEAVRRAFSPPEPPPNPEPQA